MKKAIIIGTICVAVISTSVWAVFNDVNKDNKYYDEINYVKDNGIFYGESEDMFAPDKNMTRGMLAQVIYNLEENQKFEKVTYLDVNENDWFFNAISWNTDKGILKGMGNNKFEPYTEVTKAQLATALYNYAKYKNYDVSVGENTNILSYDDAFSMQEYAYQPMQWAFGVGILKEENGKLNHSANVTRAEVASIMKTFSKEYIYDFGVIKLEGNSSTGYVWKASGYDENIISVEDYKYYEEGYNELLVGGPGVFEFKVFALEVGKTEIVFEYIRPWENEAIKKVICDVEVDTNGRLDILLSSAE